MPKFLVSVAGKVLVDAPEKDAAKSVVEGRCSEHAPWLKVTYGDAERLADINHVAAANAVYQS